MSTPWLPSSSSGDAVWFVCARRGVVRRCSSRQSSGNGTHGKWCCAVNVIRTKHIDVTHVMLLLIMEHRRQRVARFFLAADGAADSKALSPARLALRCSICWFSRKIRALKVCQNSTQILNVSSRGAACAGLRSQDSGSQDRGAPHRVPARAHPPFEELPSEGGPDNRRSGVAGELPRARERGGQPGSRPPEARPSGSSFGPIEMRTR